MPSPPSSLPQQTKGWAGSRGRICSKRVPWEVFCHVAPHQVLFKMNRLVQRASADHSVLGQALNLTIKRNS